MEVAQPARGGIVFQQLPAMSGAMKDLLAMLPLAAGPTHAVRGRHAGAVGLDDGQNIVQGRWI